MKNILLILILVSSLVSCINEPKEKHPTKKDYLILWSVLNSPKPVDNCISDYSQLNPLFNTYLQNDFINYSTSCQNIIIGDSTMDLSRQTTFYDKSKTNNYSVSGNTACDYLYQMEYINCTPQNVLIATADGNGILRNVSSQASINTLKKVIDRSKVKWNPNKIIVIGVHPVLVTVANRNKNYVNNEIAKLTDICYINPLPIWGVGENDLPRTDYMLDSIHYKQPIYDLYKAQILSQCGVSL